MMVSSTVIPGRRDSGEPGIQRLVQPMHLDSGLVGFAGAPE
jgi:hypothetical protein